MKVVCKHLVVIFLLLPFYGYTEENAWKFDSTYSYEDFRYRFGSITLNQTVLRITGSAGQWQLERVPNLVYYSKKGEKALYEIKEGSRLYKEGKLICVRALVQREYGQSYLFTSSTKDPQNPAPKDFEEVDVIPPYLPCPDVALLYGGDNYSHFTSHYHINETALFYIVLDEFDGEWGKMDGALKDGKPLYVRVQKEERHKFDVGLSRNEAVHAARALIPDFDKSLNVFLECLKDKNSKCSKQLRVAMVGPTAAELEQIKATPNRVKRIVKIKGRPVVSKEAIKIIEKERLPVLRRELIAYLERGGVNNQEYHDARFYRRYVDIPQGEDKVYYRFEYGMYLQEIDSIISFYVTENGAELNLDATGTFIAPYREDKKSTESLLERRVFAAELIREMRLGGEVGFREDTEYIDPYIFLRMIANDSTWAETQKKHDYRKNMKRSGIDP